MQPVHQVSESVVGSWVKLPSPMSVEVLFAAGADFICLDMCNGWMSLDRVNDLLAYRGAAGRRLVRLPAHAAPPMVGQILDAGADGVVIAHVDSVAQAREMVAAALFAPAGTRGMGSTGRAGQWGLAPIATYLAGGQLELNPPSIALMIESIEALRELDELARIPGVSQLLIGTADLGAVLGRDQTKLQLAADDVLTACAKYGLSAAVATGSATAGAGYLARGFDTIFISNDLTLLGTSAQQCFHATKSPSTASSG